MTTIAIIGAGMMGSALAMPLADNGHDVRLVGTHLDRESIDSVQANGYHPRLEVEHARVGAGVPARGRRGRLRRRRDRAQRRELLRVTGRPSSSAQLLKPGQLLIMVAKGMEADEEGDLRILPDVLAADLPEELSSQLDVAAIVGPSIAGELAARRNTCVMFAGRDQAALDRLAETSRATTTTSGRRRT